MSLIQFPVIDPVATGANIMRLRRERGLTVRDLQRFFGFEEPQAIYKWQRGQSLPSVDNLYALSALFGVPMNEILVSSRQIFNIASCEQQASACCSGHIWGNLATQMGGLDLQNATPILEDVAGFLHQALRFVLEAERIFEVHRITSSFISCEQSTASETLCH